MRISVVIPSFNQARYLSATLDSLAAQDYPQLEVLIRDGGSTDGSVDILRGHPAGYRWISEADDGQADAINRGFQESTGEVLAFLNSDDVYYPDALRRVSAYFAEHPDCLALYGEAHHLHADGTVMERYYTEPWNYSRLQEVCFLCQPAVFWRREVMERHGLLDDRLHFALDYEYWLRVGKRTDFHFLEGQFLAGSRLHADTKTLGQRVRAHREILQVVLMRGGSPAAVWRWLKNLAHYEAAESAAPSSALAEERRLYVRLFTAAALRNAAHFGVRLAPAQLDELTELMEGTAIQPCA